jgi:hypothetical protein
MHKVIDGDIGKQIGDKLTANPKSRLVISGRMAATGAMETRIMSIAPICACSIICFSSPSTPPGKYRSLHPAVRFPR